MRLFLLVSMLSGARNGTKASVPTALDDAWVLPVVGEVLEPDRLEDVVVVGPVLERRLVESLEGSTRLDPFTVVGFDGELGAVDRDDSRDAPGEGLHQVGVDLRPHGSCDLGLPAGDGDVEVLWNPELPQEGPPRRRPLGHAAPR